MIQVFERSRNIIIQSLKYYIFYLPVMITWLTTKRESRFFAENYEGCNIANKLPILA